MRKGLPLLSLWLFACSGGDDNGVTPPDPLEYFHMAVGNWWTYEVDKGKGLDTASWSVDSLIETYHETLTITAENAGVYTWVITYDNSSVEDTMGAFVKSDTLMLAFTKTFSLITDTFTISDTVPYAPCPLSLGITWSSTEKLALIADIDGDMIDDTVYYHIYGKVEKIESLSLPPWQFDDCSRTLYEHHFRIISSAYGPVNTHLDQRIWWAPNQGPVRWIDRDYRDTVDIYNPPFLVKNLSDMGGAK